MVLKRLFQLILMELTAKKSLDHQTSLNIFIFYFLINTLLNVDASTPADIQSLYNVSHNFQTFYIYTNYYTRLPYHVQSLARWPGKCRSSWFKVRSNGCFPHPHLPRKSSKSKAHTIPPPKFKSLMNFVFRRTSPTSS